VEDDEDIQDIQWIMDLIASDKLYTINIKNVVADVKDKDMAAFLSQEMNIKKVRARAGVGVSVRDLATRCPTSSCPLSNHSSVSPSSSSGPRPRWRDGRRRQRRHARGGAGWAHAAAE
tara:strand:+ start:1352 stop:1705 length:354 start_codon:yes stop_codon:yes gene_type:complete